MIDAAQQRREAHAILDVLTERSFARCAIFSSSWLSRFPVRWLSLPSNKKTSRRIRQPALKRVISVETLSQSAKALLPA